MSMEFITIIVTILSAGIALAALIITGQNSLRREMQGQRKDIDGLREENRAEFKAIREENQAEFKAVRETMQAHREENQAEFKAVRETMQAHREENQAEFKAVRKDLGDLRERTARVEGMLEGLLREAFIGRRTAPAEAVAEDPAPYDKR